MVVGGYAYLVKASDPAEWLRVSSGPWWICACCEQG